ncbi:hypothetical protein LUZ60_013752 [Juncus effusus]|nr:hypothetical protein LUZ60_013752 [Juncus effusus]
MAPFLLFLVASLTSISTSAHFLGVNYGTPYDHPFNQSYFLGDDLPPPDRAIQLIQSINGGGVRIYHANSTIIQAASSTNLSIAVSVPNDLINSIANNQSVADTWITTNILPFGKHIKYIFVGNEIFSDMDGTNSTWGALVPAMKNIYRALQEKKLRKISVTTPFAMNCITTIFPPSSAQFRADIPDSIISSLLKFLSDTDSFYFVNAYPYSVWSKNYKTITLDYALFIAKRNNYYVDSGTKLTYTNLLDQMLDSTIYAMRKLGYNNIKLGISETGWPNAGDINEIGASDYNAAMYNRNLAHILAVHKGTPLRPGKSMPAFVFALFNENYRSGAGTERHWGLFYPNETSVYPIDLTGRKPIGSYPPIPLPTNNEPYPGTIWCVMQADINIIRHLDYFQDRMEQFCDQGNITCPRVTNRDCQDDPWLNYSYAMNSIWQEYRDSGMPCYFYGFTLETTRDPSTYK